MCFKLIYPETKEHLECYYKLRWKVLRKPFNQPLGSEKDDLEDNSFHIMVLKNDVAVGVGRLHLIEEKNGVIGQIRYMAVKNKFQTQGVGTLILNKLEEIADNNYVQKIILHARYNAIKFYEKNSYHIQEKSHLLFNEIQHWLMYKELKK